MAWNEEYREMVEEYAISLFAQQEVKTLFGLCETAGEKSFADSAVLKKCWTSVASKSTLTRA